MKRYVAVGVVVAATLLSGCILLPIPHEQWLSPQFSGVVVDAATGRPLDGVKVSLSDYRFGKKTIADVATLSDAAGHYSVVAIEHSTWVVIMLGPADPAIDVAHVRFEHAGYAALDEQKTWIVGGRHRFDLDVSLRKQGEPNSRSTPARLAGTNPANPPPRDMTFRSKSSLVRTRPLVTS